VESGLPNVWLKNGFRSVKAKAGEGVAIEDVEGLNRAIAIVLVTEKPRFSGAELRFLRKELGLSQRVFSNLAGVEEQTVSLWERKDDEVPEQADRFVRALYISERDPGTKLRALLEKLQELDDREFALVANESHGRWLAKAA
jgi:DNA-binding transcriptional regulator YiaG